MDAKLVAETIYQQLGAGQFKVMTGARKFGYGNDSNGNPFLQFYIPANRFNVNKISMVQIILDVSDTYTLKFFNNKKDPIAGIMILNCYKTIEDIYCDNLRDVFEVETNLLTSFDKRSSNAVKVDPRTARLSYL